MHDVALYFPEVCNRFTNTFVKRDRNQKNRLRKSLGEVHSIYSNVLLCVNKLLYEHRWEFIPRWRWFVVYLFYAIYWSRFAIFALLIIRRYNKFDSCTAQTSSDLNFTIFHFESHFDIFHVIQKTFVKKICFTIIQIHYL